MAKQYDSPKIEILDDVKELFSKFKKIPRKAFARDKKEPGVIDLSPEDYEIHDDEQIR